MQETTTLVRELCRFERDLTTRRGGTMRLLVSLFVRRRLSAAVEAAETLHDLISATRADTGKYITYDELKARLGDA